MQLRLLIIGAVVAIAAGGSASHASGFSTRPADADRAYSSALSTGTCTDSTAQRLSLLQEPETLKTTHRSGLTAIR
ncbi:MAG: hypothetical protein U1E14_15335 [Geminicoccaceae bacterium]